MRYYGMTDIGKKRNSNQDSFACRTIASDALLCVVCDGMGGARGGAVASAVALEAFCKRCELFFDAFGNTVPSVGEITAALAHAVNDANFAVWQKALCDAALHGMGTTLVAALFYKRMMYAVNVGDSRLYHMANGSPLQITRDHSLVQHLIDSGKLTIAEGKRYPNRNVITRCIGGEKIVAADIFPTPLCPQGGYVLLCSDGLSNYLSPSQLYETVTGAHSDILCPQDALTARVGALISLANEAGGGDNITALVVGYESAAAADAAQTKA